MPVPSTDPKQAGVLSAPVPKLRLFALAERQGFHRVREALSAHMWAGLVMKQQLQPSVPAAVERLSTSGGTAAAAGVARSGAAPGDPAANGHRHLSPTAAKGGAPEFSAFQDAEAPAGGLGELSALPMADDPNDPVQEREFTHLMDGLAGAITINTNGSDLHASYV